ncbi:MAG: T9SS type A sorting domain-containing protein [Flavobacteriales bacterium]|nr:T9SS type A sorting domain-containing protein [Flavobacteriales bacterium]
MKKSVFIILLTLSVCRSSQAHSGDTVYVPPGTSPTMDGIISASEWADASSFTLVTPQGDSVTYYFKHNGTDKLYIAQRVSTLINGDHCFLFFDSNHNGGAVPSTDDHWLANSYFPMGDNEHTGTGFGWSNPNPIASWNFAYTGNGDSSDEGQMEFSISFSKFGIIAGVQKTLGFMGNYGYAPGDNSWPNTSDYNNPGTWANLIIQNCAMPTASFSHSDSLMTVTISDSSLGATGWVWDFGDANTDTVQNPIHTYISAGTYNICLTATNSCGSDTACDSVTIIAIPGVENHRYQSKVNIVPNPFDQSAIVEFANEKNEKYLLTLYNSAGQMVRQIGNISSGKIRLERDNLTNGLYFLQLQNEFEIIANRKIIIE